MIHFTADQHFGHENIIRYCARPFRDVDHMDIELILAWNRAVGEDDKVYHLGDFCLGDQRQARNYFRQLKGRIFVLGNAWHHDARWLPIVNQIGTSGKQAAMGLASFYSASHHQVTILPAMHVLEFPELGTGGYSLGVTLCHYPLAVWDRAHYGAWHLHGHSHGCYGSAELLLDVGVDSCGYAPIGLEAIKAVMWDGRGT